MLNIFQYDFMVRAFLSGIIIAIIAPLIGCFLVVRRYSLLADTLAHVSLVGVAIGLLTGGNPIITATATSIVASLGIDYIRTSKQVVGESVLALFLSGSLAMASILISISHGGGTNLFSYLFGSITTVLPEDLYFMLGLGIAVILIVTAFYKQFFLLSFDEELAKADKMNIKLFNTMIIIMAAIAVSVSMRIVGVLLIGALMVIPATTAMQFALSFKKTLLLSIFFSLISVITGLLTSFYLGLASGGTIVMVSLLLFVLSLTLKHKKS